MKKIGIISICIIMVLALLLGSRTFEMLCRENRPYLSNRQQFMGVFYTHFDKFNKFAKDVADCNDIVFQYRDVEQTHIVLGYGELSEDVFSLVSNAGMTDFQKNGTYCLVYQYAPVSGSDVCIGARYDYIKEKWEFYYSHQYSSCRHYKFIYWIYDCLFNRKTTL